jgi:hypothetical protein
VGDLIADVGPNQWMAPTPCTEWNVRDVVNHRCPSAAQTT